MQYLKIYKIMKRIRNHVLKAMIFKKNCGNVMIEISNTDASC